MGPRHADPAGRYRRLFQRPHGLYPVQQVRLRHEEHPRKDVQEARGRRRRSHASSGRHDRSGRHRRHRQHRRRHRRDRGRRPGRRFLDVAVRPVRHGDKVLRSRAGRSLPRAQRQGRLGRRPDVLHQKRPRQELAVARRHFLHSRLHRRLRHRQHDPGQHHRHLHQQRHRHLRRQYLRRYTHAL